MKLEVMCFIVGYIVSLGVTQQSMHERCIRGHLVRQHYTFHIMHCSLFPPANKLFYPSCLWISGSLRWLISVDVGLLAAYIRHLVRERLFISPLPILSIPTCMSVAVYCCLISHLGEGMLWIIFTRSFVLAIVFSEKNVHKSLKWKKVLPSALRC